MARTRAYRRAQRERVRRNRIARARNLWSYSWTFDREWIEQRGRTWTKVDPFTQCSCWMCTLRDPKPEVDWLQEYETY
jgi:hypothetical protein